MRSYEVVELVKALAPLGVALSEMIVAFIQQSERAGISEDPELLAVIDECVRQVDLDHREMSATEKRATVAEWVRLYCERTGRSVADGMLNALIELSVQRQKARTDGN